MSMRLMPKEARRIMVPYGSIRMKDGHVDVP